MLRLEVPIIENSTLYDGYVRRAFQAIQQDISLKANRQKYKVREPVILGMDFIKWNDKPPDTINLFYYVTHSLYLHKGRNCYIIELNDRPLVTGSKTLVKDLVRLLEYGNENLPPYPLIREILLHYQIHWEDEFENIVNKTMFK